MQEIFVNIFHKFDFERQKMAEEKQGDKIITPLGWDIKRNAKGQFVPNNEQLRKLVYDKNVKLSDIDTSEITDMKGLFAYIEHDDAKNFWEGVVDWAKDNNVKLDFKREDFSGIGSWDTSKVTTFERMFYMADNFNEDISKWDTSKAISFKEMFYEASNFNQPLNSWNTSKVTDMSGMFWGATNFNKPLDKWNTSSVTDMSNLFCNAFEFNCSLNDWDTSKVADMNSMFAATSFNQPLDKWDTSSVTDMSSMFYSTNFNQPLDKWNTSKVTNMSRMFHQAINFNQPLDEWDTSNTTNMSGMFMSAKSFNQNLRWWGDKLDKVKDMSSMFWGAKSLICDFFSWWETSEVCGLKDRIKDSGVEKLRDALKKIKDKIENKYEQKEELAKMLGFDEKESKKIIDKPALSNFDIYKVVINEGDFLKSILPYEGEGEKVVKNWLVKDVAYRVYLLRYNERNDEFTQDKSGWDFAFCKVFESWFMIKKNSRLRNKGNEKLPSQLNEALLLFRIYQGRDMRELEEQSKRKFNKDKEYVSQNRELTIYFEQIAMHILDGGVDFSNQKIVQDIVYAVVLAKAYNIKMENLRDTAKESANDTKRLKECYKEVCDFDLKKYYSIPITQNGKDSNANVVLMEVWHYISNVCFVTQQHDELKDVIAQMSRVLTDDKRDSQSWWFSVAAVAIAFVSFVVAAISAVPVIEKWLG